MTVRNRSLLKRLEFFVVIGFVLTLCLALLFASATVAFAVRRSMAHPGAAPVASATPLPAENNNLPPGENLPDENLKTFHGMLTDSVCGARHAQNTNRSSAECVHACVRRGAGYVLINGESSYALRGKKIALSSLAGQRVTVLGTLQGSSIGIHTIRGGD